MGIEKNLPIRSSSLLIIAIVFLTILGNTFIFVLSSIDASFNIFQLVDFSRPCENFAIAAAEEKVIIRIDDVQAFAWWDTFERMAEDAFERNIPLVLAVIPQGFNQDRRIVDFLEKNKCLIEIAQHGWDGGRNGLEFADLNEAQALDKIMKGKLILEKINKEPLVTFVPPSNVYSQGTAVAVAEAGFKVISSRGGNYFDYTAATYDFEKNRLIPVTEILANCQQGLAEKKLCTIMIHPQDYVTNGQLDMTKYADYLELLDELRKMNVAFVRMKDILYSSSGEAILDETSNMFENMSEGK